MQDTWNSIGLFQPFDGYISRDQATTDAERYGLSWGTNKPTAWIQGNTSIDASYYLPFDTDADTQNFGDLGHDLTWWQTGPHPDWVLYKCDQKTPAYVGGLPDNVPLDISNPDVVAYQMALVAPYMMQNGYNTLSADVLSLQNGQGGCGVWTQNHKVWVQKFTGQKVDQQWADAAVYWAAYAQWYLHGLPTPMPFVVNSPLWVMPNDQQTEQLIAHVDGFMDEAGFTGFGNHMPTESVFQAKVWWAQYIQSQNKAFMVADLWHGSDPNGVQRDFAIATYLMGRYHFEALFTAKYGSYDMEHYWPEYALSYGSPCGDMYPTQNVYFRKNSGSLTIVNVGTSEVRVTLPKSASSYTDVEGRTVTNPLSVGSDDGWVLLTSNGCN